MGRRLWRTGVGTIVSLSPCPLVPLSPMDRRLWRAGVGIMVLPLVVGLVLIVALALGWNSPRPTRPPDWQPPGLPFHLIAASHRTTVTLLGHPSSDFTWEGEAIPLSGPDLNGYGLIYRAQDAAHYDVFAVGSDGYYAVLRVTGDEEVPLVDWQQFPHVRRGRQANRLRVSCTGSRVYSPASRVYSPALTCRFYVNDEMAATLQDGTWLSGDVGLWVANFDGEDVAVQFTNLHAWAEE
jgi:hypothetical protein